LHMSATGAVFMCVLVVRCVRCHSCPPGLRLGIEPRDTAFSNIMP
jgi:hypothetical protein